MEIPASLLGKAVTEGHIYYFKDDCPVGIRGHMHVCIKHHNEYLIFSTCSSQVSNAVRLAQIRKYNVNTYPVISPNRDNGFAELTKEIGTVLRYVSQSGLENRPNFPSTAIRYGH